MITFPRPTAHELPVSDIAASFFRIPWVRAVSRRNGFEFDISGARRLHDTIQHLLVPVSHGPEEIRRNLGRMQSLFEGFRSRQGWKDPNGGLVEDGDADALDGSVCLYHDTVAGIKKLLTGEVRTNGDLAFRMALAVHEFDNLIFGDPPSQPYAVEITPERAAAFLEYFSSVRERFRALWWPSGPI